MINLPKENRIFWRISLIGMSDQSSNPKGRTMQQYLKVSMTILILLFIPGTLSCCSKSTSSPKTSGREVEFNQSANSTASQIPALVTTSLISQSHVSGNMPDTQVFDQLLQNDLNEQMTKKLGKPIKVSYELLRKAPTQAGTGFPKFYCWVKVLENNKVIEEGAIRVAAMEKKHFEIYQFMSLPQIRKDPQWVYEVYPKVLCEAEYVNNFETLFQNNLVKSFF